MVLIFFSIHILSHLQEIKELRLIRPLLNPPKEAFPSSTDVRSKILAAAATTKKVAAPWYCCCAVSDSV
ncbi:unnamed protein product [Acanthoscelides obtectus]|uniref:Uncharacterized protein n=1 Tax=Acanthoscelides obtectus TaxID=200917 RepID=A0A9P0ME38_ACAOB|nr:unnamed protein product [Acanthoscelides obtectus]CAK1679492.1 hypothetical protein AOBTE_LOCUS32291 [Acanthoscelides obtectus]